MRARKDDPMVWHSRSAGRSILIAKMGDAHLVSATLLLLGTSRSATEPARFRNLLLEIERRGLRAWALEKAAAWRVTGNYGKGAQR